MNYIFPFVRPVFADADLSFLVPPLLNLLVPHRVSKNSFQIRSDSPMKIAQVAPLYERVPPVSYGGTERIVSYLTEELIHAGHDVTLFASGDSLTSARLVAPCERALRLCPDYSDCMAYNFLQLEQVFQLAGSFDLVHFHIDYVHFPFSRRERVPHVTTLHGRLDIPDLVPLYREFDDMPLISIS